MSTTLHGSCLCGRVRFAVDGPFAPPDACHCTQCRKWSGHVFASTDAPRESVRVEGAEHVEWYASSPRVRRGFCRTCGASLFWDPVASARIGIAMGAFDGPTPLPLAMHIFVAEKGDYYAIADALPQHAR